MTRFTYIFALIALVATITLSAQRRIDPVTNAATITLPINENKANGDSLDRSRLVQMTDSKGLPILVDTITGREFVDSVALRRAADSIPPMIYPLLHSATFYVDVFQGVMCAFGQHYGLVEFGAELSLHNRYKPVVEFGLGQAKNTPDDNNFTYSSPLAPFFRLGINYNFLYNSNPDYQLYAGVRYGFSPFKWSVTDVTQPPGYWDEPISYNIQSVSATAGYFELLLGLRVNIFSNFSLGWAVKFHKILHESSSPHGQPWYIPGYGSRNGSLTGMFTLSYTIPLGKRPPKPLPGAAEPSLEAEPAETQPETQSETSPI